MCTEQTKRGQETGLGHVICMTSRPHLWKNWHNCHSMMELENSQNQTMYKLLRRHGDRRRKDIITITIAIITNLHLELKVLCNRFTLDKRDQQQQKVSHDDKIIVVSISIMTLD